MFRTLKITRRPMRPCDCSGVDGHAAGQAQKWKWQVTQALQGTVGRLGSTGRGTQVHEKWPEPCVNSAPFLNTAVFQTRCILGALKFKLTSAQFLRTWPVLRVLLYCRFISLEAQRRGTVSEGREAEALTRARHLWREVLQWAPPLRTDHQPSCHLHLCPPPITAHISRDNSPLVVQSTLPLYRIQYLNISYMAGPPNKRYFNLGLSHAW